MSPRRATSRVVANVLSGWGEFGVGIAVTLFLTPFVLHRTGVEQYGVLLLVESLLSYSAMLYLEIGRASCRERV